MTERKHQPPYPPDISEALADAERTEWTTLFFLALNVAIMTWAIGGSQAFKTAWIEDMLSLLAPASFLVARRFEKRGPSEGFPFGFNRAGSLAFFFSSAALFFIGAWLLYEGSKTLVTAEHPSIGSQYYFGTQIWSGWIMITALAVSVVPPVILGRRKLKIAKKLHDKVLYVDAETNAADWRTGLASIAGVAGIGLGLWWADAAMAILISLSIVKDGYDALKGSTISLLDGAPRALDSHSVSREACEILERLKRAHPGARVQIRETGRFFRVQIAPADDDAPPEDLRKTLLPEDGWRLIAIGKAVNGYDPALKELVTPPQSLSTKN